MLTPQIVANLSQQVGVSFEFAGNGYCVHLNDVAAR
jgi:hypothetical protein